MAKHKFIKYENIFDESVIFYALEKDGVERSIGGVQFKEVTTDFIHAHMICVDSLKAVGSVVKEF
jgi:hypothetical protein